MPSWLFLSSIKELILAKSARFMIVLMQIILINFRGYLLFRGKITMQQNHKIITLTSLIIATSTNLLNAHIIKPLDKYGLNTKNPFVQTVYIGNHGEGEGGEGGELGEGGFNAKTLKTDDIAFGTALEVIHAHYLIGEKLYALGDYDMAQNFFGHPISEVLSELQTAFEFRNIQSPEEEMYALLEIAQEKNKLPALQEGIKKVIIKINNAFDKIQVADKKQHTLDMAQINGDLIRRTKLEYFEAIENSDIGALQDSVGYFLASKAFFEKNKALYTVLNADKTDDLSDYFDDLEPFFANFQEVDSNANHKKLAGIAAKLELGFGNFE
jgi:hypothetical protein